MSDWETGQAERAHQELTYMDGLNTRDAFQLIGIGSRLIGLAWETPEREVAQEFLNTARISFRRSRELSEQSKQESWRQLAKFHLLQEPIVQALVVNHTMPDLSMLRRVHRDTAKYFDEAWQHLSHPGLGQISNVIGIVDMWRDWQLTAKQRSQTAIVSFWSTPMDENELPTDGHISVFQDQDNEGIKRLLPFQVSNGDPRVEEQLRPDLAIIRMDDLQLPEDGGQPVTGLTIIRELRLAQQARKPAPQRGKKPARTADTSREEQTAGAKAAERLAQRMDLLLDKIDEAI